MLGGERMVNDMRNQVCEKCRCRICLENAEDNADGMCRNCECCAENDFKDPVKKPQDCEMWEDGG